MVCQFQYKAAFAAVRQMNPRFPSLNFFAAAAVKIPAAHYHHTKAPDNLLNGRR